jgi:hypothetical protein
MITFFYFVLLIVACFGVGRLGLCRVKFARAAEEYVFSSALGLAVLSYGAFLLGALGRMTPRVVVLVFVACCLISIPICARFLIRICRRLPRFDLSSAICLAVLVAAAILNTIIATNPVVEVDTFEYHIPVPKAWLLEGRIFPIPYCVQSNYHLLGEMINVVTLSLHPNDVILCKLMQLYAGVLLAVATWCFGRSFFSARVAWLAATLTYLVKEISWISTNGYVDLTVGLYVWLGVFAMIRAAHLRGWAWHAIAGLFFGLGFASKQTGATFAAMSYFACGATLLLDRQRRRRLRLFLPRAVLAGILTAVVAGPWIIKNCAFTGDPFYPFLVQQFNVPHEFAAASTDFTGYYDGLWRYIIWDRETWPQLLRAFYSFRTNVVHSGANMLVVWLLISCLVLILRRCPTTYALRLLIAVGLIVAPWFLNWSRFIFGFFPVYLLILAQTLRLATGRRSVLFISLAIVLLFFYARTFVTFNLHGHPVASFDRTGGPTWTPRARENWLRRKVYEYSMIQEINRVLGPRDRLLASGGSPAMPWLDVRFLPNPDADLPDLLWKRFGDIAAMRRWLESEQITHVLLDDSHAGRLDRQSGFVRTHLERMFGQSGLALYRLK